MAGLKRKSNEGNKQNKARDFKNKKQRGGNNKGKDGKRKGPRLPNAMLKELQIRKRYNESDDEEIGTDDAINDFYEYEEGVAEEETRKNRRFDPVENFQYELPDEFEDENVSSDDEDGDGDEDGRRGDNDEEEEEDDGRHSRLLQDITGLPTDAFDGKKKKNDVIISEAYSESEYNPSRDILDGDGRISIQDLLDPLHGKSDYSKLRKTMSRMEKKSMPIHAPLPKPDQERLDRKAAYGFMQKDVTKWEPHVKRNREAPTIYFDEDKDVGFSTVGAIAAEFEPRTDFEKKIASLFNDHEVVEAHKKDGARLLELNKISVEDVRERQNQLAKMKSLLFRHEMKAKRVKKIKSKVYHRLLKKDRLKQAGTAMETDPEAAKEQAMKQEFKRAEERLTLKHKNSSKWAKRILKRGLDLQDEGTRVAIHEQLNQHALLSRKANNMKDSSGSSSEESSDEDDLDEASDGSDQEAAVKLLKKAKDKTTQVLEGDEELPVSGVLSLPFMVRGLKRRKEAADEEAKLALEEYESSLKELEDNNEPKTQGTNISTGRRVFGAQKKQAPEQPKKKVTSDNYYGDSDSEGETDAREIGISAREENKFSEREVHFDPNALREESEIGHDSLFKSFDDIARDPNSKTSYEVSIFAADSWKKMNDSSVKGKQTKSANAKSVSSLQITEPVVGKPDREEIDDDSDADSGGEMVDGILTSGTKSTYEIPSQEELIRRAFAGDDVEDDFEREKQDALNEEIPEPEKPVLLPGWGQWTNIQKKRGPPSWMLEEHDNAKKKREEVLKKRKDANLNHVIISEKRDKKAEKLHTPTLPYPFTSQEVFEQSIRMPIGPDFNPGTAVGALIRPEVVKRSGIIIKPIKFEEVNPHERAQDHKRGGVQKKKGGQNKGKATKKKTV
ncbi:uncharacterized protein LOC132630187 isoform X1 [Lycium barbarum]|uniref:uncharacterized protein LOC132630187 isoform X1 n=1 Tax=Lycium barbarum TaxID=112863 RepID=UPI00293E8A12|nr:uncharacterized protein LOC132630187 isoform X1 [Lycium barbarum]